MSPEQARGETVGMASDVYSLALVLYELATGQRPFGRQSLDDLGSRRAKPPRPSTIRTRFPETLDQLIDRMLEPEPAKRIGMREVAEQFRRFEGPSALDRVWKVTADRESTADASGCCHLAVGLSGNASAMVSSLPHSN